MRNTPLEKKKITEYLHKFGMTIIISIHGYTFSNDLCNGGYDE